ncbi:glycoside hydrolase family 3 C-terminal domain-containing protein [candidate division WOR-3 bacterium]|nr:glycoside hydrolase family 3 C-terminal domain-containing protein [candidate division WOR-3 bacterium]
MKKIKNTVIICLILLIKPLSAQDTLYLDSTTTVEERVEDLLGRMTIEEKVGQMIQGERRSDNVLNNISTYYLGSILSGGGSSPYPNTSESWADMYDSLQGRAMSTRLGIPIIYGIDAVHGHNNAYGAVIFPHNIGLGCTRDSILAEETGKITAMEVSATGLNWTFSPCIAVARNERWGRTYESFGETPELTAMMGSAIVRGLQGDTIARNSSIVACAKHYVADGGTTDGIDRGNAEIDEETLRAIHLPGYIKAIENNVGSIMISFSSWNGVRCHGNAYLIDTVLKQELGFEGFVISDWDGIAQLGGSYADNIETAINAGIDMAMTPFDYINFYNTLIDLVEEGNVDTNRINNAVRRILRTKFKMGLFERPYADRSLLDSIGTEAHRAVAREAVRKSLVLLKKKDGILPLSKEDINIFLAGEHADNLGYQCGGWTIYWQGYSGDITVGTTIWEAIQEAAPGADFTYSREGSSIDTTADVAVVAIGETPYAEGSGDRYDLSLPVSQINLIRNIKNAGLPVVVILISGRPLIIESIIPYSDAIIAAWLPGTEGQGITDVLFDDYNPSGLLSHSWPAEMEDIPINFGDAIYEPLFEYGYGITDLADSPPGSAPIFYSAAVDSIGTRLQVAFNKKMLKPENANSEFIIDQNGINDISVDSIETASYDSTLFILHLFETIQEGDNITIEYSGVSVFSEDGGQLEPFGPEKAYNRLDEPAGINEKEDTNSTSQLIKNYPNPFNEVTYLGFRLSEKEKVSLSIYNIYGQKLETLVNEELNAGEHIYQWDAGKYPSGIYFYKLDTHKATSCGKMILLK